MNILETVLGSCAEWTYINDCKEFEPTRVSQLFKWRYLDTSAKLLAEEGWQENEFKIHCGCEK